MDKSQIYETKQYNRKKVLLVDLDDTISNLLDNWLAQYSYKINENIYEHEITDWDLTQHELIQNNIFDLLHDPSVYLGAKPKEGAVEALKLLQNKYDIYIVSSCNEDAVKAKSVWLQMYFPFIPIQHFIACTPKHLMSGYAMIDDRPDNLVGFKGKKILMGRTFNDPINYGNIDPDIKRVTDWNGVLKILLADD